MHIYLCKLPASESYLDMFPVHIFLLSTDFNKCKKTFLISDLTLVGCWALKAGSIYTYGLLSIVIQSLLCIEAQSI